MKKTVAYAAALGLALSVNTAMPGQAKAEPNNGAVTFCKFVVDELDGDFLFVGALSPMHFSSVGDCVAFIRTKPPVKQCKAISNILDYNGLDWSATPWKNFGQCVKLLDPA